jgi:hypothetical protein
LVKDKVRRPDQQNLSKTALSLNQYIQKLNNTDPHSFNSKASDILNTLEYIRGAITIIADIKNNQFENDQEHSEVIFKSDEFNILESKSTLI